MNPKRLMQYLLAAGIILLVLVIVGAFFLPWRFVNWGTLAWRSSSTVTVVGEAKTQEQNKQASFTAGINVVMDKKEQAITEVNLKITAITDAVKAFGIKPDDIKTQNLSIYQEEETYTEGGRQKQRLGQWRVSNSIEIVLRDIEKAGALADVLSSSGANSVYGPNFTLDEESRTGTTLLAGAVTDARKKADILAKAAGKNLGDVITLSEGTAVQGRTMLSAADGMGGGAELSPGSETVRKSVTVTFELKDVFPFTLPFALPMLK
jgi:uncharacterized protein YggE